MAKTLVALYDTFADAERVVQELIADGFARSDIHMAFDRTKSPAAHAASVAVGLRIRGSQPERDARRPGRPV